MKTTVERESPTKLRLEIEVAPEELDPLYEATMKRLAGEINVPGFRKGKAPRALIESRVGEDAIRQEVLRDALPALYARAAGEESLRPVANPEIEVTDYEKGEPLRFTAVVEVRPRLSLPEYRGIEVAWPEAAPTEADVAEQLERLRERFGTLEPVARNAEEGDFVTIDLKTYRHDQQVDDASAQDLLYEIGSGSFVPELDTETVGKRTGDIYKFNAVLPDRFGSPHGGEEVTFSVLVKDVQTKRLPALDDEFAKTASEFDTLEELSTEIRSRLEIFKKAEADAEVRNKVIEDLIDRTDVPLPETMINRELERRILRLARDLERAGSTLDQYLAATSTSSEALVDSQKEAASKTVAAELVLEAVAEAEGLDVTEEDLDAEIERIAGLVDRASDKMREELEASGAILSLTGDILRRKALDYLVSQAKVDEGS